MATIVLLYHGMNQHIPNNYVARVLAERWREGGHTVLEHFGAENPPPGDILFMHVDVTVIPEEYRAVIPLYPRAINGTVMDISKRSFSQNLVARDSDWNGPVLVKTDMNYFGRTEWVIHALSRHVGAPTERPVGPWLKDYPIFPTLRDVPDEMWRTPGLVVEKFLPERDHQGFYLRTWMFLGDRERSLRFRSGFPIVKRDNIIDREPVPVPDEIRAWREKLGFDFGKFDYLMHEGRPVLIDTNRTPGAREHAGTNPGARSSILDLAEEGLNAYLS